ncbi:MAG: hypothetical protein ACRD3E_14820 [Terriglobales bacterium]
MKKFLCTLVAVTIGLTGSLALAATQAVNTNTVAPQLQISATIQKAVSLTLSTGTTAGISHCAVVPTGGTPDYTMNFGTVDALGINNGNCNKIAPTVAGTDNAIYWTDYSVLPVFTSHQNYSNTTVTAYVSTDFAAPHNIFVVRSATSTSSTTPAALTDFAAMSVASGSPDTIGAAGTASGTALTRFVGVAVTPANGATVLQGAQSATVTFTLTVN